MIYNHKYSVHVIERADIYCTEMNSPMSITSKTKDHAEPFTLPFNSQADFSRSIRPKYEQKEQQSQSVVNINSVGTMNSSHKDESQSKHSALKDVPTVKSIDKIFQKAARLTTNYSIQLNTILEYVQPSTTKRTYLKFIIVTVINLCPHLQTNIL